MEELVWIATLEYTGSKKTENGYPLILDGTSTYAASKIIQMVMMGDDPEIVADEIIARIEGSHEWHLVVLRALDSSNKE